MLVVELCILAEGAYWVNGNRTWDQCKDLNSGEDVEDMVARSTCTYNIWKWGVVTLVMVAVAVSSSTFHAVWGGSKSSRAYSVKEFSVKCELMVLELAYVSSSTTSGMLFVLVSTVVRVVLIANRLLVQSESVQYA